MTSNKKSVEDKITQAIKRCLSLKRFGYGIEAVESKNEVPTLIEDGELYVTDKEFDASERSPTKITVYCPGPDEGPRFLEEGEFILEGDELFGPVEKDLPDQKIWQPIPELLIGTRCSMPGQIRRRSPCGLESVREREVEFLLAFSDNTWDTVIRAVPSPLTLPERRHNLLDWAGRNILEELNDERDEFLSVCVSVCVYAIYEEISDEEEFDDD